MEKMIPELNDAIASIPRTTRHSIPLAYDIVHEYRYEITASEKQTLDNIYSCIPIGCHTLDQMIDDLPGVSRYVTITHRDLLAVKVMVNRLNGRGSHHG